MQALLLFAVAIAAAICAVLVAVLSIRRHIKPVGGLAAVILAAAAVILCITASSGRMLISRPSGDPGATVESFFSALEAGDYAAAYSCLEGCSSLGLENDAADEAGRRIQSALRGSYACEPGSCLIVDGLTATDTVAFSHLDIAAIRADAADRVNGKLEAMVESREPNEIYDENDNYLPELVEEAYLAGIAEMLAHPEAYIVTESMDIRLEYVGGSWLIVPDAGLFSALMGGAI